VAFERPADEVAGAKATARASVSTMPPKRMPKASHYDVAADLEVVEDHGGGENEHQPLDAEREEPRVLQLHIDGSDEDRNAPENAAMRVPAKSSKTAPTTRVR